MTDCSSSVSLVIPTFQREAVLLQSLHSLISLEAGPDEILVIDQTPQHRPETQAQLGEWHREKRIKWVRLTQPSIPRSMNVGLSSAVGDLVLFLDDDIQPLSDLVARHREAFSVDPSLWATVGQVIQPWQIPKAIAAPRKLSGLRKDCDFPFHSTIDAEVQNVMAGNLCVNRKKALSIGGFDENFTGAAYRFETEFARRIINAGGRIRFLGTAGIHHLRVSAGGTRSEGSHLTSASPHHGIGDHYYAFLHGDPIEKWIYSIQRVFREVSTKFHATHPWWIPVKLVGELRAMWGGWRMAAMKKRATSGEQRENSG